MGNLLRDPRPRNRIRAHGSCLLLHPDDRLGLYPHCLLALLRIHSRTVHDGYLGTQAIHISGCANYSKVLGHECGHSALFPRDTFNHVFGFALHSFLLTPYFAWRSTHRRHHKYANNVSKDHTYVPLNKEEYLALLSERHPGIKSLEDLMEDSPLYTLFRIILQQLTGFPTYLLTNITASKGSLSRPYSESFLGTSHFLTSSSLFRPGEARLIIISDLGLVAMITVLYFCYQYFGLWMVGLLYFQPYLWVNHWIVAITYLHHTHPSLPKYDQQAWSFIKGATATIDRSYGWAGQYCFHDVADYHVIHHLFP